jgi:hypothetical protein
VKVELTSQLGKQRAKAREIAEVVKRLREELPREEVEELLGSKQHAYDMGVASFEQGVETARELGDWKGWDTD